MRGPSHVAMSWSFIHYTAYYKATAEDISKEDK